MRYRRRKQSLAGFRLLRRILGSFLYLGPEYWILSDMPSSQLLQPEVMPYGERSSTASISCRSPFSTLNSSAISHVHGCCGPAETARPSGVLKSRVFPAG